LNRPAANKPRKPFTLILRAAYCFFLTSGILGLGYVAYAIADEHAYQALEKSRFENDINVSRSNEPRNVIQGDVIGEMEIPRLGLKTIVVQGDSPKILRRAVGHIAETALPGNPGNVSLAGHRDGFFRPLRNIQLGDAITLKTLDGNFQYQVESTAVVPPNDMQVLQPTSERTLTLVTCFPFYYVGSAPNRFIVRARQVELSSQ
jgi:LPXTG-site transpeptidase (sortase) family protein